MAELTTLARPYARAAFEYARDANALDRWSSMLATLAAVSQDATVAKLLDSPHLSAEQKGDTLVELCSEELDEKAANYIKYLARNDRLSLLPQVYTLFEDLKAEHEKTVEVSIVTAFELTEEQQGKLLDSLKAKLQRDVNLHTAIDESLIGGVVIRAGDMTIDGSVRGRLARLAEAMV